MLGQAFAFVPLGHHLAHLGEGDGNAVITPSPAGVDVAAGNPDRGRELYAIWACGSCHALADAGTAGRVGPPLDGNPNLTYALVVNRVTYGQGAMPAFGGQLSEEDIADLAAYIVRVAAK